MLEIVLVILAIIAIVGACIYFYVDMKDHKATNTTDFEKVAKNIEEEEKTRLGNIKYVVDQVNTTNEAMDAEYTAKLTALEKNDTGFGTLIGVETSTGGTIALKDVTAIDTSKIKLMKDVSVIGNMSIKDLQSTVSSGKPVKTFQACGIGSGAPCIQFPNSEGHTYLTGLATDKHVVSGSLFKATAGLQTNTINNLDTANLSISTGTSGNNITLSQNPADGIKITSGTNYIEIKNGSININTGADTQSNLNKITLNSKAIGFVGIGNTHGDLPAGTRVLTLAA